MKIGQFDILNNGDLFGFVFYFGLPAPQALLFVNQGPTDNRDGHHLVYKYKLGGNGRKFTEENLQLIGHAKLGCDLLEDKTKVQIFSPSFWGGACWMNLLRDRTQPGTLDLVLNNNDVFPVTRARFEVLNYSRLEAEIAETGYGVFKRRPPLSTYAEKSRAEHKDIKVGNIERGSDGRLLGVVDYFGIDAPKKIILIPRVGVRSQGDYYEVRQEVTLRLGQERKKVPRLVGYASQDPTDSTMIDMAFISPAYAGGCLWLTAMRRPDDDNVYDVTMSHKDAVALTARHLAPPPPAPDAIEGGRDAYNSAGAPTNLGRRARTPRDRQPS